MQHDPFFYPIELLISNIEFLSLNDKKIKKLSFRLNEDSVVFHSSCVLAMRLDIMNF